MLSSHHPRPLPTSHHQGRRPRQIATDRSEVKGGDGCHEALETEAAVRPHSRHPPPLPPAPLGTSSPRYTVLLVLGGTLRGCSPSSSTANLALNRKKSISSAAASISAWITVLPCEAGGPGAQQRQLCPASPHGGPCAHGDIPCRALAAPAGRSTCPHQARWAKSQGAWRLLTFPYTGVNISFFLVSDESEPRGKGCNNGLFPSQNGPAWHTGALAAARPAQDTEPRRRRGTALLCTATAPPTSSRVFSQTQRHLRLVFEVRVSLPARCGPPGALWSLAPTPGAAESGDTGQVQSCHTCVAGGLFSAGREPGCPEPLGPLPGDGEFNPFSLPAPFPTRWAAAATPGLKGAHSKTWIRCFHSSRKTRCKARRWRT